MSRKAQRQWLVLVALVLGLAAILYMQFSGDGSTARTAVAPSNQVPGGTAAPRGEAAPVTDVKLELLQSSDTAQPPPARNPFRFRPKPTPPPPAPRASAEPPPQESAPPPVPSGPPPLPPITLRFIGVVESPPPAGRVAVLSDGSGRNPPVYGKEGDIIEGRYQLLRVGPDSIDIAYLDGRGRQTIRMSGQ